MSVITEDLVWLRAPDPTFFDEETCVGMDETLMFEVLTSTPNNVTGASNAESVRITAASQGLTTDQACRVSGVQGNPGANSDWRAIYVDANNVEPTLSWAYSAYTTGGTIQRLLKEMGARMFLGQMSLPRAAMTWNPSSGTTELAAPRKSCTNRSSCAAPEVNRCRNGSKLRRFRSGWPTWIPQALAQPVLHGFPVRVNI